MTNLPQHRPAINFGRYTERSYSVLLLAEQEAARLGHQYIGTEHILLGLLREGEGIGAGILQTHNITLEKMREAVEFIIGKNDTSVGR